MRAGAFTHSFSNRPAFVVGRFALFSALLLAFALGGTLGCGSLNGSGNAAPEGFRPIARPEPAVTPTPDAAANMLVGPTTPTTVTTTTMTALTPGEIERPGNPAAWGDSAQLTVGRQFEPVYFDAESYELDVNARQRLRDYAAWLREHPKVWVTLAGHADQSGAARYAYNLAMARALAAQDYLIGQGLPPTRLFAIGFGADLPALEGRPEETRTLNNRVELLAFIAPLGYMEPDPIPASKQPAPDEQDPAPVGRANELIN